MKHPGRRAQSLAFCDQAVSSLQNFLLLLLFARQLSALDFSRFAVYTLLISIVLGLMQATLGDYLLLQAGHRKDGHRLVWSGALLTVAGGLLLAVAAWIVGFVFFRDLAGEITMVFAVAPVLLLAEYLRLTSISVGLPGTALAADCVWTLTWLVGIWRLPPHSLGLQFLYYGALAAIGIVVNVARLHQKGFLRRARPLTFPRFMQRDAKSLMALFREYISLAIGTYGFSLGLGFTVGVDAVGALRAAQGLFGPINTLTNAIRIALTPALSEKASRTGALTRREILPLTLFMVGVAGIVTIALSMIPTSWGESLLGASWANAHAVIVLVGIQRMVASPTTSLSIALRSGGRLAWSTKVKAIYSIVVACLAVAFSQFVGFNAALIIWIAGSFCTSLHLWCGVPKEKLPLHSPLVI